MSLEELVLAALADPFPRQPALVGKCWHGIPGCPLGHTAKDYREFRAAGGRLW